jgi:hypothetical protein
MPSMLVLCDGMPKSGSTFLYQVCKKLAKCRGVDSLISCLGNDQYLHKIPGTNTYSGFSTQPLDLIQSWNDYASPLNTVAQGNFCIKIHLLNETCGDGPLKPSIIGHQLAWVVSARDPYDVAQALVDQSQRELQKPPKMQRIGFTRLSESSRALRFAVDGLKSLEKNLIPGISVFLYPEFIHGSSRVVQALRKSLSLGLDVSDANILSELQNVDIAIRSGDIWGEFNKGREGRGASLRDKVDTPLAEEADSIWASIQALALRQSSQVLS